MESFGFVEVETPVLQVCCYPHSAFLSWHLWSDYLLLYGQDACILFCIFKIDFFIAGMIN